MKMRSLDWLPEPPIRSKKRRLPSAKRPRRQKKTPSKKTKKEADDEEYKEKSTEDDGLTEEEDGEDDDDLHEPEEKTPRKRASTGGSKTPKTARKKTISKTAMTKTLKSLTQAQLVELVCNIVERHPDFKEEFESMLPHADVGSLLKALSVERNRIHRAFPNSRFGSSGDSFCFRRVRPSIGAFKAFFTRQLLPLGTSQRWDDFNLYITEAAKILDTLPVWDHASSNSIYLPVFAKVLGYINTQLKSKTLTETQREDAERLLKQFTDAYNKRLRDSGGDPDQGKPPAPLEDEDGDGEHDDVQATGDSGVVPPSQTSSGAPAPADAAPAVPVTPGPFLVV